MACTAASASAKLAPSSTQEIISPRNRLSKRFTTNAGRSATSTHDFLSPLPTAKAVARQGSSVFSARAISSSGMSATGLKKWNPTTRSGCAKSAAISATESDDVLVAKMQSGRTTSSNWAKTTFFTSSCSKTASITKSASEKRLLSVVPVMSALSRLRLSSDIRPFVCRVSSSVCA